MTRSFFQVWSLIGLVLLLSHCSEVKKFFAPGLEKDITTADNDLSKTPGKTGRKYVASFNSGLKTYLVYQDLANQKYFLLYSRNTLEMLPSKIFKYFIEQYRFWGSPEEKQDLDVRQLWKYNILSVSGVPIFPKGEINKKGYININKLEEEMKLLTLSNDFISLNTVLKGTQSTITDETEESEEKEKKKRGGPQSRQKKKSEKTPSAKKKKPAPKQKSAFDEIAFDEIDKPASEKKKEGDTIDETFVKTLEKSTGRELQLDEIFKDPKMILTVRQSGNIAEEAKYVGFSLGEKKGTKELCASLYFKEADKTKEIQLVLGATWQKYTVNTSNLSKVEAGNLHFPISNPKGVASNISDFRYSKDGLELLFIKEGQLYYFKKGKFHKVEMPKGEYQLEALDNVYFYTTQNLTGPVRQNIAYLFQVSTDPAEKFVKKFRVPRLKNPIVLDGGIKDWLQSAVKKVYINHAGQVIQEKTCWVGRNDASFTVRLGYFGESVYLAIVARDQNHWRNRWMGDHFLVGLKDKKGNPLVYTFYPADFKRLKRQGVISRSTGGQKKGAPKIEWTVKERTKVKGWVAELKFPKTLFENGGLYVCFNDVDTLQVGGVNKAICTSPIDPDKKWIPGRREGILNIRHAPVEFDN